MASDMRLRLANLLGFSYALQGCTSSVLNWRQSKLEAKLAQVGRLKMGLAVHEDSRERSLFRWIQRRGQHVTKTGSGPQRVCYINVEMIQTQ